MAINIGLPGAKWYYAALRESAGQSRHARLSGVPRKVRAPQGKVPGNAWEARAYGKCHRKYTAYVRSNRAGKGEMVR